MFIYTYLYPNSYITYIQIVIYTYIQNKLVEVTGAYKHGRYDKNWRKSLHVVSNVKVFVMQDGQSAGKLNEHDSLHRLIYYSYGSKISWTTPSQPQLPALLFLPVQIQTAPKTHPPPFGGTHGVTSLLDEAQLDLRLEAVGAGLSAHLHHGAEQAHRCWARLAVSTQYHVHAVALRPCRPQAGQSADVFQQRGLLLWVVEDGAQHGAWLVACASVLLQLFQHVADDGCLAHARVAWYGKVNEWTELC